MTVAGCGGGGQKASEEVFHNASLEEVGSLLSTRILDSGKPPTKLADLTKYEVGLPTGYKELKEGNIVVLWGAPIAEGATDTIIAYEKAVPDSGGYVLMQDGVTVKKMTADQFKAANKAPGKSGS